MNSSYNNKVDFGDIISTITFMNNPQKIVECGILEGYSLSKFIESSSSNTSIDAYDIFDKFNGNHAIKDKITEQFSPYKNVTIDYGDFYNVLKTYPDKSIDILHIDIANNGDVYEFVFENYVNKVKDDGIILMEGGSEERDNVDWMIKYNKPKITPVLKKWSNIYNILTIGEIPSITIIQNK
tara:strand:+ start:77 stop:622 length:546 start_codon:yes stop_codon:yes gene_type:complete